MSVAISSTVMSAMDLLIRFGKFCRLLSAIAALENRFDDLSAR